MLNWSNTKYKFTLGIGSLATTAIMAELWKPILPVWVIMVVALLPLVVFVFVHPDEMPARLVLTAHVFASVWYLLSAIALSIGLIIAPKLPEGWLIFPVFCAVGLIPCVLVLSQAARKRYGLPKEQNDSDSVVT
jgi:hypothetical protein